MTSAQENIPSYLNKDFITQSLTNGLGNGNVVVDKFDITPATAAGDNYMSDVFRIHVKYRLSPKSDAGEQISLVVKCMPDAGQRGPVIEELNVYEKEEKMFVDVIPALSKIANNAFFAAKCYYSTKAPERMLVFHDLKSLNYTMANRHTGLDFDHCALIMKKIGKFHAASISYSEHNKDILDKFFNFSMFNPSVENCTDCISVMFENGLKTLISVAEETWIDFDPKILEKLKLLVPVYVAKLQTCLSQKFEDGFKVLNHGDLWCNNMLFKYNKSSEAVEDVVFVDYQLSYFSSPGIDLNYAISNCPNLETRDRTIELIDIYYDSLKETLQSIKHPRIPTLADVHHEIKRMEFFSLVSIISVLPIVMMEKSDTFTPSFEAMIDEKMAEQSRRIQYSGKQFQAIVQPMLKRFYDRKLLDV